jgi:hypothetical protein
MFSMLINLLLLLLLLLLSVVDKLTN